MALESRFRWVDEWAALPDEPEARRGWMHTGVLVNRAGEVLVGHPGRPELLAFDAGGELLRATPVPGLVELHAFALAADGESLWIADNGTKFEVAGDAVEARRAPDGGAVVLLDPGGTVVERLPRPPHPAYAEARYAPTSVALDEAGGGLWVADGYGASLVHRLDAQGRLELTLTGEEGAGRFDCPHGLLVVRRAGSSELWITDRGHGRIQVYSLEGAYERTVGSGLLVAPTVLAQLGDEVVITDFLGARLTVLDGEGGLRGHLFANPHAPGTGPRPDEWPNARAGDGSIVRPPLTPGVLNSPHAVTADGGGNLYVTEWLIGGRVTKLARAGGAG